MASRGWRKGRLLAPHPAQELAQEAEGLAAPGGRINPSA
jgi:hypothetical protein